MLGLGRWVQAAVRYSLMSPLQVVCRWIGSAGPITATSSPAGARCLSAATFDGHEGDTFREHEFVIVLLFSWPGVGV